MVVSGTGAARINGGAQEVLGLGEVISIQPYQILEVCSSNQAPLNLLIFNVASDQGASG